MSALLELKWDENGLIPAIVQDANTHQVLMLGWMDSEALAKTVVTGYVHFWSRSRQRLWRKGEESGNVLVLSDIAYDCDGDALLVKAWPQGPTCHTGNVTCFYRQLSFQDLVSGDDAFGGRGMAAAEHVSGLQWPKEAAEGADEPAEVSSFEPDQSGVRG